MDIYCDVKPSVLMYSYTYTHDEDDNPVKMDVTATLECVDDDHDVIQSMEFVRRVLQSMGGRYSGKRAKIRELFRLLRGFKMDIGKYLRAFVRV